MDFQDHRPYVPGDDPRYINWQAYARTGEYSMKLYREEVRPLVDIVLDGSSSMFFEESKAGRSFGIFMFALESILLNGASARCYIIRGNSVTRLPLEQAVTGGFLGDLPEDEDGFPLLQRACFRGGSLRLVITDCLFPGSKDSLVNTLSSDKGRGIILCPYSDSESVPAWIGNVEF
ncbi:unnamed protein product, partial [marine sediment metagenome]